MSNRIMNQSGIPASPLAMRANLPVSRTEDQLHENRVADHSKHSIYPTYQASFKPHVPNAGRTMYPIESATPSQPVAVPGID